MLDSQKHIQRASYGIPIMNISENTDRVLTAPHGMYCGIMIASKI